MSDSVGDHIFDNWKILSLLGEKNLSKKLYLDLLIEKDSIVRSLTEFIINASSKVFPTDVKFKKTDLKQLTATKGSLKKKRSLLATPYYRKSVVPYVCEAALKYLDDGSDKSDRKN